MKKILSVFGLLAVVILMAVWQLSARAELVEHHGQQVDAGIPGTECLACHDGTVANVVSSCTVKCDFGSSHPIFKEYPPRGKETEFAPLGKISEDGIRLENGQVTCVSCHNLKNPAAYHLVLPNNGSALCLICHVK
jgi:hypothetical protein